MGTRSLIAAANADGTFSSIYCHWDGYPSGVGKTLMDHYTDPAKVAALMALGSLSSLGEEIGEKHDFDRRDGPDVCTAYGRDRGDTGEEAGVDHSFESLCKTTKESGGEYLYVFKDGQWFCAKFGYGPVFLESMAGVLQQEGQNS